VTAPVPANCTGWWAACRGAITMDRAGRVEGEDLQLVQVMLLELVVQQ
jgi:hypothetical protein